MKSNVSSQSLGNLEEMRSHEGCLNQVRFERVYCKSGWKSRKCRRDAGTRHIRETRFGQVRVRFGGVVSGKRGAGLVR